MNPPRRRLDLLLDIEHLRSLQRPTPQQGRYDLVNILMIINGAAYGQDSTYNAVRLAASMAKRDEVTLRVFLMGDGVTVAMAGQKTPDGYYKLDRMLSVVSRHGGQTGCCGTCMDARGITEVMLVEGAARSTMDELTDWTLAADKVLVF